MAGANSSISDTDWHPVDAVRRAAGELGERCRRSRIEDDVWLGANVVVLKGVTIGKGTTVAANSVVTKSIPPRVIAAGVPARVVKQIPGRRTVWLNCLIRHAQWQQRTPAITANHDYPMKMCK